MANTDVNPLMLDFPESFESDRLLIRAPRHGDGAAMNEAVRESIEELKPWMPWAASIPSLESSELLAREGRIRFLNRSDLWLLLFHKETGVYLGGSGLHRINWNARTFEIGYWIRTDMSGQGYVTEAVKVITAFAFRELDANRLEIRCDSRNEKSASVARRAGFILEGTLRNNSLNTSGELSSTMVFSKLREDQ